MEANKTALLVSKIIELQKLQYQNFTLDVLENWVQAHRELDIALTDDSIFINIREEAQKVLEDVQKDMYSKAKQLLGSKFNDCWKVLGEIVFVIKMFWLIRLF